MANVRIYPISIEYIKSENNHPYLVEIPDLNLYTEADSKIDAIYMARDLIGSYSLNDHPMPESNDQLLKPKNKNTIVTLVDVDIEKYQRDMDMKLDKKTLTIPHKYNVLGTRDKLNFSEILTNELMKIYN